MGGKAGINIMKKAWSDNDLNINWRQYMYRDNGWENKHIAIFVALINSYW